MRFEAGASWRILVLIFFLCFRLEERNNGIRYVNTYHLVIVSTVATSDIFRFHFSFSLDGPTFWNGMVIHAQMAPRLEKSSNVGAVKTRKSSRESLACQYV